MITILVILEDRDGNVLERLDMPEVVALSLRRRDTLAVARGDQVKHYTIKDDGRLITMGIHKRMDCDAALNPCITLEARLRPY